jgi:uncharacterized phage-associated protein
MPAHPSLAVANAFVEAALSGSLPLLTPMKLQRMVFAANALSLSRENGPLVAEPFHRWPHGPAIPSLHGAFESFGPRAIAALGPSPLALDDPAALALVAEAIALYGSLSGPELSTLFTRPRSAWALSGPVDGGPIPDVAIERCALPSPSQDGADLPLVHRGPRALRY